MEPIRVVWGTGRGPTELAAYDAALAAANVHEYNLIELSSIIPRDATVEEVGTAPELGPIGDGLHVVQAAATGRSGPVSAALAWARAPDGAGVFYEEAATTEPDPVVDEAVTGLDAAMDLRENPVHEHGTRVVTTEASDADEQFASAVAVAVYGESEPLL